ncbi:MAG: signal peptidase I [Micrococcales bacterium]|nr:signal peptidase I [Micrococcales bacterium]
MTTTSAPAAAPAIPRRRRRAVDVVLAAALLLTVARVWVLEPVEVPSTSMTPTIEAGDHVLVDHVVPLVRGYHRGDVVVLSAPGSGELLVKRVAGVAGDEVAVRDGVLEVDGVPVDEPWVDPREVDSTFAELGVVPADRVIVLADHRPEALDSRTFGPVPLDALEGRVVATLWPLDRLGRVS